LQLLSVSSPGSSPLQPLSMCRTPTSLILSVSSPGSSPLQPLCFGTDLDYHRYSFSILSRIVPSATLCFGTDLDYHRYSFSILSRIVPSATFINVQNANFINSFSILSRIVPSATSVSNRQRVPGLALLSVSSPGSSPLQLERAPLTQQDHQSLSVSSPGSSPLQPPPCSLEICLSCTFSILSRIVPSATAGGGKRSGIVFHHPRTIEAPFLASERLVSLLPPRAEHIVPRSFSKLVFCKPQGASFEEAALHFRVYHRQKCHVQRSMRSDSDRISREHSPSFEAAPRKGHMSRRLPQRALPQPVPPRLSASEQRYQQRLYIDKHIFGASRTI
jgi:hypothetical protein